MPRIKDYPKYEDHVDKTMTWDKGNKELLPPGRTKLLQDGRFIFDMDDGTYTVSMQYFIENVLGLVNKDKKTIISDVTMDGFDSPQNIDISKAALTIHREEIDVDGNLTGHKTSSSYSFADMLTDFISKISVLNGINVDGSNAENDFINVMIPYNDEQSHELKPFMFSLPVHGISDLNISDGKLTYYVDNKVNTLDLKETINNVVSSSGEVQQKVSDLVDFRMSPMTPLINSAITSIEVSDTGNMHWLSYDGNTTDGSFDFGALIDKKTSGSKPADLPTDLTRNLNVSNSGAISWTVNGEKKNVDIGNGIVRRVSNKLDPQLTLLSTKVDAVNDKVKSLSNTNIGKYVKELSISSDGNFTWTVESGEQKRFNIHTVFDNELNNIKNTKSDQSWVKDQISQAITTYSSGVNTGQRLAKFAKNLNVDSSGTMTWESSDGQSHSVNLKQFGSSSSASAIPVSYITNVL